MEFPIDTIEHESELISTCELRRNGAEALGRELHVPAGHRYSLPSIPAYFHFKYLADRIVGWLLLLPAAPLIGLLWSAVKISSPGPGFYLQKRVGLNGRVFQIVKLRTMIAEAEQGGKIEWSNKQDIRVTKLGRILRKLHLDELPQLWNVARGEMSLVGPRPERPEITASLDKLIPGYHFRHRVKPGITGLSQVNLEPDSNINLTRKKQIIDLRYIRLASPWLDARMLLATSSRLIGISGDWSMRFAGLEQVISDDELASVDYEFDTLPHQLWDPTKGPVMDSSNGQARQRVSISSSAFLASRKAIPNAFTVDVEDYFQVSAFEKRVSRKHWDQYESRVEPNTNRLLGLLDKFNVTATFFILGWVADRYPNLVRRIHTAGHEVASHGYWHRLIYNQTPEDFADDICMSRYAIENACGVNVTAYRAPSFSITRESLWALEILAEHGFTHDSSIFPIVGHDSYGLPEASRDIHRLVTHHGTITEYPPSAWHFGHLNIPIGGGYFRILPYSVSQRSLSEVRGCQRPAMFYTHPWEIDPTQPKIRGVGIKNSFRHYTGLHSTESRLEKLLSSIPFASMSEVIAAVGQIETVYEPVTGAV